MQVELFDARVLQPLVGYLESHGARSEPVLDRARIPRELIEEGGWVTKKQAYDFALDVVERSGRRDAVFAAYLDFEFAQLGPIAQAMRGCKTVKEALDVATRLGSVAYQGSEYFLRIDGDTTWFCYRESQVVSPGQTFINDMTLTVYLHLIRATANEQDWRPEQMLFREQDIDRHRSVANFEDCNVKRHPHCSAMGFPAEFLSRRVPWPVRSLEFSEREAWLFGPEGSAPIVDVLYRLIVSRFPYDKPPTLDHIATLTGASPAALKRKLAAGGMTYRALLDRVRFDSACELLSIPRLTIREIAQELGFSGTNNFVRSFRRMTGMTPGEYRQLQYAT